MKMGMANNYHSLRKKSSSFKMKTRINIRRHGFVEEMYGIILAKFQPNWLNGCRLGVQNVSVIRQNFPSEIKRKIDFLRHLTWNEIMTPKRLF